MSWSVVGRKMRCLRLPYQLWRVTPVRSVSVGIMVVVFLLCLATLALRQKGTDVFSEVVDPRLADFDGSSFRKALLETGPDRPKAGQANDASVKKEPSVNKTSKLPGCIIVGARKCGTRALIEFLALHPDVAAARKEIHFFSNDTNYAKGLKWYRSLMPRSKPGQLTMEKTPRYFVSPAAPTRIHRMNSSVRIVIALRHPVTRLVSDYTQLCYNNVARGLAPPGNFTQLVLDERTGAVNSDYTPVLVSTYDLHVARWLAVFPRRQIHFVDGDRLITQPLQESRRLEAFLGLPPRFTEDSFYFNASRGFYCMKRIVTVKGSGERFAHTEKCLGAGKGRKHQPIEQSVLKKLNDYFQHHNEILFKMIGQRFDWR
ncbi:heparan sulfate glucosamine 3-o-sulfotransferase 5 [Plakobranchus ocellatus]|uniref:Heparan sulfate glucosamine 3-o-sulfotransferase 5 n=1 Tax=Plakobranchus ocellatus TaxID=259542 RepID=A0AAV3YG52_9GAST|nr:heparan sulfate glucosamine 3-o-sulfotransferase 5 [Plakobranchus ocellatus]